jgi:hypothetical protein
VNDETGNFLREYYVSPSIMMFYQLKRKMTAETDAPTYGFSSSRVNTMKDIEAVADQVLADGICKLDQHRGDVGDAEVTDLHRHRRSMRNRDECDLAKVY